MLNYIYSIHNNAQQQQQHMRYIMVIIYYIFSVLVFKFDPIYIYTRI